MNRLRFAFALLASTVLMGLVSPATTATAASVSLSKYESDSFKQTNKERVKAKRVALKSDKCLKSAAQSWAKNMAKKKKMYHQPLSPLLKKCKLRMVGENVAYGYPSGAAVTKAWMNSPGHRANIMNKSYRLSYVGVAKASNGQVYAAQLFGAR